MESPVLSSDSRRAIERDIRNLCEQHGYYSVIHALIEHCYERKKVAPKIREQDVWDRMCAVLSVAEDLAQDNDL